MGNENQDTVALLEKCVDVDKRRTRRPEAVSFVESTVVKRWQRYMNDVKKWEDSRLLTISVNRKQTSVYLSLMASTVVVAVMKIALNNSAVIIKRRRDSDRWIPS
jgi:hypothetical protein